MRRREFIGLLGGIAAALPLAAKGQQGGTIRRIGVLLARAESDPVFQARFQAFRTRLQQLGWTDGDNLRIDYRWTAGIADRFLIAAVELVTLKPEVILADATPSVAALKRETQTIPIVFVNVTDPVAQGFIASLAHPGSNITGFAQNEFSLGGKWLALLKDAAPRTTRVGLMYNPTTAPYADGFARVIEAAAPSYEVTTVRMLVQSAAEIDGAVKAFAQEANGGLIAMSDSFLFVHRDRIVALATEHRLPVISDTTSWVRDGGLIAYQPDADEGYRGAASYVDRILRGAKASELPVQEPTKYHLSVNLKTAKALGLKISESLLLTADEVIE
jgi:putative ABC transport system substrate-binding protein